MYLFLGVIKSSRADFTNYYFVVEKRKSKTCINKCGRLSDGDYQSCKGCDVYASCWAGQIVDNRPCPAGLLWDDNLKNCNNPPSSTCPCKFVL